MSAAPTPGPWVLQVPEGGVVEDDTLEILGPDPSGKTYCITMVLAESETDVANARLMAASPLLFAALETLVLRAKPELRKHPSMRAAVAALKAAVEGTP